MLDNSPHQFSRDVTQNSNMKKKLGVSRSTTFFDGINDFGDKRRVNSINRLPSPKSRLKYPNAISPHESFPNYNTLIKNPFKHHMRSVNDNSNTSNKELIQSISTSRRGIDPAEELIEKTAKGITQFIFKFEIEKQNVTSTKNYSSFRPPKPRFSSNQGGGLKPLNCVNVTGPSVTNCLGIIREPTNINFQLREIYDKKCELLAKKRTLLEQNITYPVKLFEHNNLIEENKFAELEN